MYAIDRLMQFHRNGTLGGRIEQPANHPIAFGRCHRVKRATGSTRGRSVAGQRKDSFLSAVAILSETECCLDRDGLICVACISHLCESYICLSFVARSYRISFAISSAAGREPCPIIKVLFTSPFFDVPSKASEDAHDRLCPINCLVNITGTSNKGRHASTISNRYLIPTIATSTSVL